MLVFISACSPQNELALLTAVRRDPKASLGIVRDKCDMLFVSATSIDEALLLCSPFPRHLKWLAIILEDCPLVRASLFKLTSLQYPPMRRPRQTKLCLDLVSVLQARLPAGGSESRPYLIILGTPPDTAVASALAASARALRKPRTRPLGSALLAHTDTSDFALTGMGSPCYPRKMLSLAKSVPSHTSFARTLLTRWLGRGANPADRGRSASQAIRPSFAEACLVRGLPHLAGGIVDWRMLDEALPPAVAVAALQLISNASAAAESSEVEGEAQKRKLPPAVALTVHNLSHQEKGLMQAALRKESKLIEFCERVCATIGVQQEEVQLTQNGLKVVRSPALGASILSLSYRLGSHVLLDAVFKREFPHITSFLSAGFEICISFTESARGVVEIFPVLQENASVLRRENFLV